MNNQELYNIIEVKDARKSFKKDQRQELLVLDKINLSMVPGEIVALLGKSGSGKSTLLRILSGLVMPSEGQVLYRGKLVRGPVQGISMVFQNFALMPWLTVLQNVELGLEALGLSDAERRSRALQAIDTIGLDGFESAFPKELSGGMRQRVGLARALVVDPDILLMDEPFSALDVLTAENLRSDLLDLWTTRKTRINSILLVTHNIEEAVGMADRILIFGSNPGTLKASLTVDLEHPRSDQTPEFRAYVERIYELMTQRDQKVGGFAGRPEVPREIGLGYRLPDVNISELTGLVETLGAEEYDGHMELSELSEELHLDVDELFPLTEVLEIMRFAKVSQGDIVLTAAGRNFSDANILTRKKIFSEHLQKYVPLAKHIREALDQTSRHRALEERFISELEEHLSEKEAQRVLKVVIDWGRYAELFAYDYNSGVLSLENPK